MDYKAQDDDDDDVTIHCKLNGSVKEQNIFIYFFFLLRSFARRVVSGPRFVGL